MIFFGDTYCIKRSVISSELAQLLSENYHCLNLESTLVDERCESKKFGVSLFSNLHDYDEIITEKTLVNLANNHIMDGGEKGLNQTICRLKEKKIHFFGAGENLEKAQSPLRLNIRGKNIVVIGRAENEENIATASQPGVAPINPLMDARLLKDELSCSCTYTVVVLHIGNEFSLYPSQYVIDTYSMYKRLGFDIVVGHHPHIPQYFHNEFYSLGNFCFDFKQKLEWRNSDFLFGKKYQNYQNLINDLQNVGLAAKLALPTIKLVPIWLKHNDDKITIINDKHYNSLITKYEGIISWENHINFSYAWYRKLQLKSFLDFKKLNDYKKIKSRMLRNRSHFEFLRRNDFT